MKPATLMAAAAAVVILAIGDTAYTKYTKITTGATCERIKSKAHCEEAAKELGLSDTSPSDENLSGYPPYCYEHLGQQGRTLWFNTGQNAIQSVKECHDSMACLCHKGDDKSKGLALVLLDESEVG